MIASEERLRVLQMIEDGRISATEGARMLSEDPCKNDPDCSENDEPCCEPRWLRVEVTDIHSGKTLVNVKLPVNLLFTGLKMGARLSADMQELNLQQINDYIKRGITGQVMEVVDDGEGEKTIISLE